MHPIMAEQQEIYLISFTLVHQAMENLSLLLHYYLLMLEQFAQFQQHMELQQVQHHLLIMKLQEEMMIFGLLVMKERYSLDKIILTMKIIRLK